MVSYQQDSFIGQANVVGVANWDVDRWQYLNHADFWHGHAVREIKKTYGHDVSIYRKSKTLNKFGRNTNNVSGEQFTVMDFQGDVFNESLLSSNAIDSIVSSSGSDTETIRVEGHTQDANGLLTFVVQNVTLTGQTPASLTTPLARVTRAYVANGTFASPASDLVGTVAIYDSSSSSGVGSGVPNTDAAVHAQIRGAAGKNQTEKCATAVSNSDYWLIREAHCASGRTGGTSSNVDFEIEVRQLGGVWRPVGMEVSMRNTVNPFESVDLYPLIIVPPNSDVRMVATATVSDTPVAGRIEGVLAQIV